MCFRFQGSVCLLLASLGVCIACHSPHAFGEDPPRQLVQQPEWEARIEAALDAKGEWAFEEVPLKDVCAAVQEKLGIDVALDVKALEEFGIDPATPITRSLGGISNRSALRLILRDLELTYTMRHGALWITTPEVAESRLTTKVHPVGDLLVRDSARGEGTPDYDTLEQAIMSVIAPDAWDQVGGSGAIEGIYDTLVVSQTSDIHEQVAEFIKAYRMIVAVDKAIGGDELPSRILGRQESAANIIQGLEQPLTAEFKDAPLGEVIASLADSTGIPILIDTRSLEDFGIDTSMPVSGNFSKTPLRFALRRILNEMELTYIIRDEVLIVTTPEQSESQLEIGLYPVRDLVQIAAAPPIDSAFGSFDFDSLIRVIESIIQPDSWDSVGGPGAVEMLLPAPTLMISQTSDVHEEISELLAKLRAAKKLEAARTVTNEEADPTALIVRSYPIYAAYHAPDEVVKLVMRASEPGTWDEDAGTFVQGLGMSIVAKHNASGHRQVQKLLSQLGVWSPQMGRGRKGFGGGVAAPGAGAQPAAPVGGGGFGGGGGVGDGGFF